MHRPGIAVLDMRFHLDDIQNSRLQTPSGPGNFGNESPLLAVAVLKLLVPLALG